MADIITTGTSGYSAGAIDTASTLINNVSPIDAKHPNGLSAAITQVETVLGPGTTLKGSLATLVDRLAVILEATGLVKSGIAIPSPTLSGTIIGTYTLGGSPTLPNAIIAGTAYTMNPYVVATTGTAAHLLTTTPTTVTWYLECLVTDAGYGVGDRVFSLGDTAASRGFSVFADSAFVGVSTDGTLPAVQNRTTGASTAITAAKWKLVVTPFKRT